MMAKAARPLKCAATHNFYMVSGVRRIKGFGGWELERRTAGTEELAMA